MVLGERGYVFTMITSVMVLIILSLVMFQTHVFTPAYEDTITKISLNELHYFVEALKRDASRACSISAQRSAAYSIDHIIKTNESFSGYVMSNCTEFNYYETGVEAAFAELMLCGTLDNTVVPALDIDKYMENNTILDWVGNVRVNQTAGLPYNVSVRFRNMSMALYDSWHYVVITEFDLVVGDTSERQNIFRGYGTPITAIVEISMMEDPSSYQRLSIPQTIRTFSKCNKTINVNGSTVDTWIDDGCYHSAGNTYNSPSFFDRLEGNTGLDSKFIVRSSNILSRIGETPEDIGLESIINMDLLVEYNVSADGNLSQIDYLYWNKVPGLCKVDGMIEHPNFRVDIEHAIKYRIEDLNCDISVAESGGTDTYTPGSITVPNGTTVTWVEKSGVDHGLMVTPPIWTGPRNLPAYGVFRWTFTQPDVYAITCADHAGIFILRVI